jgi:hypothetical protein
MSSEKLFLSQPRRNRYVLRLYKCIEAQRLASADLKFVVHGASCIAGIDLHIAPAHVSSKEPLQLGAGGAREAAGVIGLGGGELHHNGTHWRSLLIQRKDRVPNRNVRTIRRLCAASLVGSTLVGA